MKKDSQEEPNIVVNHLPPDEIQPIIKNNSVDERSANGHNPNLACTEHRPKRISFSTQSQEGVSSVQSEKSSPCSVCAMSNNSSQNFSDEEDDDEDDEEAYDEEEDEDEDAELEKNPSNGSGVNCNGVYHEQRAVDTTVRLKKNMATDTKVDLQGYNSHPLTSKWLRQKQFTSLPRSASSSMRQLLNNDSGANSSVSLNDSPRHLVTYVTSSLETIPVEINQDIPDVML